MVQSCLIGASANQRAHALTSSPDGVVLSVPATAPIRELHPTQMTVGYREVVRKRRRWREAGNGSAQSTLRRRVVPIALGPNATCYLLDRHHWVCALLAEGVVDVPVLVLADLQVLDQATFWSDLSERGWCYPYDAQGHRQDCSEIPSSLAGLQDDPFRSLASALRRAGGYAKDGTFFSEFARADVLRRYLRAKDLDDDFDAALQTALVLSRSPPLVAGRPI